MNHSRLKVIGIFSWSYWFSSRSQGLLQHPYVTMQAIVREHFLRPLVLLPLVCWLLGWFIGLVLTRVGMLFNLGQIPSAAFLSSVLVFLWLWGSVFLVIWQIVLAYLYLRFRRVLK